MKNKKSIHEQIMELDTAKFLKMGLFELCKLREKAEPEDLRRLNYIMAQAQLENKVRTIVEEETAGMGETKKRLVIEAVLKRLNETGCQGAAGIRP
jgi:hypothetical protein